MSPEGDEFVAVAVDRRQVGVPGAQDPATAGLPGKNAPLRLGKKEYGERVYAAWLGQIVGNIYGLSYEFAFIDEPGPDDFPYGFGPSLERVREVNGAFSDDDTDIEYLKRWLATETRSRISIC